MSGHTANAVVELFLQRSFIKSFKVYCNIFMCSYNYIGLHFFKLATCYSFEKLKAFLIVPGILKCGIGRLIVI